MFKQKQIIAEKPTPLSLYTPDQHAKSLVKLRNVIKTYQTAAGDFMALKSISADFAKGEFVGIIGKSGAGKSTLVNMITGVDRLTAGEVWIEDVAVHKLNENDMALWRGSNVGVVYQSFELLPSLSLLENIMLPMDFCGLYRPRKSQERAMHLLTQVGLASHAHKPPTRISGGEQQRVAIARALANDPPLIVADEPTGNLDSMTAETIFQLFEALVQQGKTVIMVTHDASLTPRFSHVLRIADGEIIGKSQPVQRDQDNGGNGHRRRLWTGGMSHLMPENQELPASGETPPALKAAGKQSQDMPRPIPDTRTTTDNSPMIQMRQIVKTFKTTAGDFRALKGINADFYKGEFVSVVGKSGSGKSTLVNMITGIDRPTAGSVQISETFVHQLSESNMAKWRGRNLGIVFQFYQLLPMLSLLENTILPMDFCDMYTPDEREARAMELLKLVGLEEHAHKMPAEVSGGQQQSAAIARALANDPPIIVADEPTGNLDSRSAGQIIELFEALVKQGKTIIMVTHDSSLAQRASRTLLLSDGEIINESIASTLPMLTHKQMLKATKRLEPQRFEPGALILQQGAINDRFYIITKGYIDVTLQRSESTEETIARMGPGQYFGEISSLLQSGKTVASVKAAPHSPVEVMTLERPDFTELLDEAHRMRQEITRVAHERLAENATQGGPGKHNGGNGNA